MMSMSVSELGQVSIGPRHIARSASRAVRVGHLFWQRLYATVGVFRRSAAETTQAYLAKIDGCVPCFSSVGAPRYPDRMKEVFTADLASVREFTDECPF